MRVAVIGGGRSVEHDVSLASAAAAAEALAARHDVIALTIGPDGEWWDGSGLRLSLADAVEVLQGCTVAVPMLHGPQGEDGTIAALLDLAGVPYVGSGVRAGAIAMDKWATKAVASAAGVLTASALLVRPGDVYRFEGPVVVKPVASGSSYGVTLVETADALGPALEAAFAFDDRVLVEEVVRGREIDLAVIRRPGGEHLVAPPLEILGQGVFDLATKYDGSARFQVPAAVEPSELAALERAAVLVYDALGCAGLARVDFFLTEHGPVLNEVNTTPGFTRQSQVPRMFAASGIDYPDLLELLIDDALSPLIRSA
jgi:D-alanine-D-alanine ligase